MDNTTGMQNEAMSGNTSIVGSCDVTMCTYNQQHQCKAGSIQVAFVEGMAHCATYMPREGALGIGSDTTQQSSIDAMRQMGSDDSAIGS
jgi:hypothetical protein